MRTHSALSNAVLAGWILATPPVDYEAVLTWTKAKTWEKGANVPEPICTDVPRRQWENVGAYDTASECERARAALRKNKTAPKGEAFPPTTEDVLAFARAIARQSGECLEASVVDH